jgi:hypothetical protein
MRIHPKATLVALAATVTLVCSLASSFASARNFSDSEREYEITFNRATIEAAGNTISCPVTMLGHLLERTWVKTSNAAEASVRHVDPTSAGSALCTGGSITVLTETLPWRANYIGFSGRLPGIQSIRWSVIGAALRVTPMGSVTCLAGTTAREPAFGEALLGAGGRVEGFRVDETRGIRLGGGFICELAGESRFIGTGTVTDLPRLHPLTVTLI